MKKYKKIDKLTETKFCWYPISVEPAELEEPVIFLTDKGCLVTHKTLKHQHRDYKGVLHTTSLFGSYAHYSNAIAWVYQKDIFPDTLEYTEEAKAKKRTVKKAKCVVPFNDFFIEGELYNFTVNKASKRITVKNKEGFKVEYPNQSLMLRNFEIVEI